MVNQTFRGCDNKALKLSLPLSRGGGDIKGSSSRIHGGGGDEKEGKKEKETHICARMRRARIFRLPLSTPQSDESTFDNPNKIRRLRSSADVSTHIKIQREEREKDWERARNSLS